MRILKILLKNKLTFLIFVKILSFVCLVISGISVTFDYLSYPYIYELIVSDNKRGFDLPAISFCTERNVFFDKNKVIAKFNLSEKYEEYKRINEEFYELKHKKCVEDINKKIEQEEKDGTYHRLGEPGHYVCDYVKIQQNFNLSQFFSTYEKKILSLSFDEIKSLTISSNQLFKYSAKVHFRNESFYANSKTFENRFQEFEVLESIYGNDFGICYTFFAKNYSIFLKDDDFIQFDINYENQNSFLIDSFFDSDIPYENHFIENEFKDCIHSNFDEYFGLYLFVNRKESKVDSNSENTFKSTRNSLNSELRFRKTSVELLSTPYMEKCRKYGQSFK